MYAWSSLRSSCTSSLCPLVGVVLSVLSCGVSVGGYADELDDAPVLCGFSVGGHADELDAAPVLPALAGGMLSASLRQAVASRSGVLSVPASSRSL